MSWTFGGKELQSVRLWSSKHSVFTIKISFNLFTKEENFMLFLQTEAASFISDAAE